MNYVNDPTLTIVVHPDARIPEIHLLNKTAECLSSLAIICLECEIDVTRLCEHVSSCIILSKKINIRESIFAQFVDEVHGFLPSQTANAH
jgi:hypothetical protein